MSAEGFMSKMPVIGGFFESDEQKALRDQFTKMAQAYQAYRGPVAQARTSQLGSQLDMFGPMQQYLSAMAPSIQPFNTQGALQAFSNSAATLANPAPEAQTPNPGYLTNIKRLLDGPPNQAALYGQGAAMLRGGK